MEECKWVIGDGAGITSWMKLLGNTDTPAQCLTLVRNEEPNATGASHGAETGCCPKNCHAEFGANFSSGNTNWQTCIFDRKLL